jgi:hypothetical protein
VKMRAVNTGTDKRAHFMVFSPRRDPVCLCLLRFAP